MEGSSFRRAFTSLKSTLSQGFEKIKGSKSKKSESSDNKTTGIGANSLINSDGLDKTTKKSKVKIEFKIKRNEQDALCNPKFIAKKIFLKCGSDLTKVNKILGELEKNDVRFNGKKPELFSVDLTELKSELKALGENQTEKKVKKMGVSILKTLNDKIQAKADKKLTQWMSDQLVGLVQRNDVPVIFGQDKEGGDVKITQQARRAKVDVKEIKLSDQKTSPSAELPKYERNLRTLPNTAALVSGGNVICFRSAKTHKTHLMEQRSKTDIGTRSEAVIKAMPTLKKGDVVNGLKFTGEQDDSGKPIFEYQPVIFTMMDANPLKAIGTSSGGVLKRISLGIKAKISKVKSIPIENERKFLAKMKRANTERFEGKLFIEHTVSSSGKEIIVREKQAIIQNHVFSGQSKSEANRAQAREGNIPGQIQMLKALVLKNPKLFGPAIAGRINNMSDKPTKLELETLQIGLKETFNKNKGDLSEDKKHYQLILEAFHANLFGSGFEGHNYDAEDSGADLAILTGFQSDYLGLSFSTQCKSGNDRTITATALKCASHAFYESTGRYYNPADANENDKALFKKFYTKSLVEFGFSNVEASRGPVKEDGKSGLKIKHSPSAFKYMNEYDPALKERGHII